MNEKFKPPATVHGWWEHICTSYSTLVCLSQPV